MPSTAARAASSGSESTGICSTEGGSHSEIIGHNCSSIDSVGLARSKLLEGPWEFHPLQLSIPQQPGPSMSSVWTGWPRCTPDDLDPGSLFCFYAAAGSAMLNTSLRNAAVGWKTFSVEDYTAW